MSLTPDEIKNIAHLARLELDENHIALYTEQLSSILDFIAQMDQVDTGQAQPLAHPLDISQRLRVDQITEPDLRNKYQKIAPLVEAGLYLVPKVIE
jgi:aspartyl-tRNA(Asn)/glutamyl-tRNA(Gln) amidotransferase subunit C